MTGKRLTAKAAQAAPDASYEGWIGQGWSDELLVSHGYLERSMAALQPTRLPTAAEAQQAYDVAESNHLRIGQHASPEEKATFRAARDAAVADLHAAKKRAVVESGVEQLTGAVIGQAQQIEVFKGCRYVEDLHAILVPGETDALDQKRFDVRFSGTYLFDVQKPSDSAWEVFTASKLFKFPRVRSTYFDPRDPPGNIRTDEQGKTAVNTYVPLKLEHTVMGDATPFARHIKKILPNDNDAAILICYLAACVQYPGVKAAWAPLLQGAEGNGKSLIPKIMAYVIGRTYTHAARASDIGGRFNSHLYGKLFVFCDEVKVTQDKASVWETLKSYVTDTWQQIEYKGGAIVQRELLFNMFFCTNHPDALPTTRDGRRICPLFCAQQSLEDLIRDGMMDSNGHTSLYFDELFHWLDCEDGLAISANFLASYPIPDDLNFAKRCKRAPRTTSTEAAIGANLGVVEQEVLEAVGSGEEGFRGGWIASHRLNWLLDRSPRGKAIAQNKRGIIVEAMGYVRHPGLPDGRSPTPLSDKQRPRLFVTKNHASVGLTGAQVTAAYEAAQKVGV